MAMNSFREDEQQKETVNLKLIARLLKYLHPFRGTVALVLLMMGGVIAVDLANPWLMKQAIDKYIVNHDKNGLWMIGGLMLLVNTVAWLLAQVRIRVMTKVSNKILLTIRQELYVHIQKLSFGFFDSRPVGKILARIIGDVNSLSDLFSNSVTSLIPDFITMIAVAVIMVNMEWRLAIFALLMLPVLVTAMFLIQTVSRKRWQVYRRKNSNMNAFTHEDFSGIRVVQSFTAEKRTEGIFSELTGELRKSFMRAVRMNDLFWPLVELSWGAGSLMVIWAGIRLLDTGTITVGLLVAFTGYISMFWRPIMNMSNFYNQLIVNLSGAERIFEILDIQPDICDQKETKVLPPVRGEVRFNKVSFGYDKERPVLHQMDFTIRPGETIALVGPTGAGKTTIINLLARFYEAGSGEVLIDGHNVHDVTLESLRGQIGIMTQDTFMFSGTIRENIRYGCLNATDTEVEAAARVVQAHTFVEKLTKGYDTDVNERGTRLSVGQRQLIALARTMLADPKILILDEATASIDTGTERLVQQGIERLLKGRTSLVIAHRLSTIRNADRIFVIDHGVLKEAGSHQELFDKQGIYHRLYMSQYRFMTEGDEAV